MNFPIVHDFCDGACGVVLDMMERPMTNVSRYATHCSSYNTTSVFIVHASDQRFHWNDTKL